MSNVYCTATIELKDVKDAQRVVDFIKSTGIEATFEEDVIFISATMLEDKAQESVKLLAKTLCDEMVDNHEAFSINISHEDDDKLSYEYLIDEKSVYERKAVKIY